MMKTTLALLMLIGIAAGAIFLQIFLSKKESRWPGLILPLLTFVTSLLVVFGLMAFSVSTSAQTQFIGENGETIIQETQEAVQPIGDIGPQIFTAAAAFLLYNIPTAVLLSIYGACRGKRNKNQALEKMSAQDLE